MAAESPMTQGNVEKILKEITIPSPPQIVADLQMEMAMPDPDLNAMADMISKDPGLAGGVLKTLNSPFYGNHDIGSISKAVMMLGEHIAGLFKTKGNADEDLEWQQIEEKTLEYLGLSQFDYDDLLAYAADNDTGGQNYFM